LFSKKRNYIHVAMSDTQIPCHLLAHHAAHVVNHPCQLQHEGTNGLPSGISLLLFCGADQLDHQGADKVANQCVGDGVTHQL